MQYALPRVNPISSFPQELTRLQFKMGALNIKSTSGLLILGGQELFWIPPMLFCFFWHMPTWVAADTVSQELGWWFQTLHRHLRVSAMVKTCFADAEKHSTRIIVYDVPIILGHIYIYHQIHQSNICAFAFLSMNLTSTLDKVTSGPPETLAVWRIGSDSLAKRSSGRTSQSSVGLFWFWKRPISAMFNEETAPFLGGLPIQDPDPCLLMFVVGYFVTFRLTWNDDSNWLLYLWIGLNPTAENDSDWIGVL